MSDSTAPGSVLLNGANSQNCFLSLRASVRRVLERGNKSVPSPDRRTALICCFHSVETRRRRADGVASNRRPRLPVSVKVFEKLQVFHPERFIHDSLHLFNVNSQKNLALTFVSFKREKKCETKNASISLKSQMFLCTRSQVRSKGECCETRAF